MRSFDKVRSLVIILKITESDTFSSMVSFDSFLVVLEVSLLLIALSRSIQKFFILNIILLQYYNVYMLMYIIDIR